MHAAGEPLRVLFVSTVSTDGGGERCLYRLMLALRDRGVAPALAAPDGVLSDRAAAAGIPVHRVRTPPFLDELADAGVGMLARRRRLFWNYARMGLGAADVMWAARRHRARILHANTPRAALAAGAAGFLLRRPVVAHVRDVVHTPFARVLPRQVLRLLCDRYIAASRATAEAVRAPGPVDVIYDGLPDEALVGEAPARRTDGRRPLVGMAAALTRWKGHEVLLGAARRVHAVRPEVGFAIAGGDLGRAAGRTYGESLRRAIEAGGLQGNVSLLGWVTDMPGWLRTLDLFVHPPIEPDPFPAVVLEAAIAGVPVVASRIGGVPEMLGLDAVLLVPPGDEAALASAILEALASREAAAQRAVAARQAVRRFTLAQTAAGVLRVYRELLGTE